MELTIESALSLQGLIGHATYLLLVVSMIMRDMTYLRIIVILSALVGITYSALILHDPVGTFWESLLVTVNVVQLAITHYLNRRARFSEEETAFVEGRFSELGAGQRRRLLNCGAWRSGEPGQQLTTEGRPVSHLIYLASGSAAIESDGQMVAICHPGTFIGEMTVTTNEPATGTAILTSPSRYWCIEATALRELVAVKPEIRHALEVAFSHGMRDKLVQSNRFIVESGGVLVPPSGALHKS
jgi:CRP-like cAMP-binding protein